MARISRAQAEQIALRLFPGAQVVSSELSKRGTLWEVCLSNGAEVKVNPQTGAVVKAETPAANGVVSGTATVSRQQAEQTALRYFPGATVVKSELEDGRWAVKLSNGGQVKINAVNGALIELELKEAQAARSDDSGRGGSDDNHSDDSGRGRGSDD
jgi:uncharacterized membrane protein YkoI